MILLQLIYSGIALGMIYAVIAFGYQLTFQTSDTLNFGQGELGFMACPKAKSAPTAEYSILLRLSAPMALDALLMTVFASCADAAHTSSVRNAKPRSRSFGISTTLKWRARSRFFCSVRSGSRWKLGERISFTPPS